MCFLRLQKKLNEMKNKTICIVGLGYVGLPLAFVIENESVNLCKSVVTLFLFTKENMC